MSAALAILQKHAAELEQYLAARLETARAAGTCPARLLEAVEYSLLAAGKRLRPALLLATYCALSAEPCTFALPAAAAIELVHTFSLVHDDLPAMDDDDLRRGRPTNHKVFGDALAILAGDAMLAMAFEWLAAEYQETPDIAAALVRELGSAAGPDGMIGGQVLDIAAEGTSLSLEAIGEVHARKTGALITCACRMGAILARADDGALAAVASYGRHLGLAFQIADDLLDVTGSSASVGKATGKDSMAGKNTYPALLGIEGARRAAEDEAARAQNSLRPLGSRSEALAALARFAIERKR